jgi:hypothetical protein
MKLRSSGESPPRNRDFRFAVAIAGFERDIEKGIQEPPPPVNNCAAAT